MTNSTEAPKSATVKVVSPSGFHWLCTVRGDEESSLMDKMLAFEKNVIKEGWTPEAPQVFSKFPPKVVDYTGEDCPKCGAKLVHASTKDGRKFVKCETNKWDFATKKAIGCEFTRWPEMTQADL